jgi:ABC-type transporter Mla maintaining outer membrane lipid asymmetry ATPase subunit MlaF
VSDPRLSVRGVRKAFDGKVVLDGIDLEVGTSRGGVPDRFVGIGQVDPA